MHATNTTWAKTVETPVAGGGQVGMEMRVCDNLQGTKIGGRKIKGYHQASGNHAQHVLFIADRIASCCLNVGPGKD